jgi:acid stress-induced BolA-like protein IbaG/YrbA
LLYSYVITQAHTLPSRSKTLLNPREHRYNCALDFSNQASACRNEQAHPTRYLETIMEAEEIKRILEAGIRDAQARVEVNGNSVNLVIISPVFDGLNAVKKQQLVYQCINTHIADGSIHAVTMKTYTPAEWEKASRFQIGSA